MVSIRVTSEEILQRTQTQLAKVMVERDILDERLNACASVMTPEQLEQVGITRPGAPTPLPAPMVASADADDAAEDVG